MRRPVGGREAVHLPLTLRATGLYLYWFLYLAAVAGTVVLAINEWPPPILLAATAPLAYIAYLVKIAIPAHMDRIVVTEDSLEWRHGWSLRKMKPAYDRIDLEELSDVYVKRGGFGKGIFYYAVLVDRSNNRVTIDAYGYPWRKRKMLFDGPRTLPGHSTREERR